MSSVAAHLLRVVEDPPEPHRLVALMREGQESTNGDTPHESRSMPEWLIDAADLLAQPDPGPTPWLVEDLIVDQAVIAAVGSWKTTKSYGLLDIAISIVTGRPAFGQLAIPTPGPVVFVIEESGRDALWRRLDYLTRGRAIPREDVRGLHLAANAGVKLDNPDWQQRLIDAGLQIRPRLFVFDPLARMKAPGRKENLQDEMAALIEYMRTLRDETGAGVGFVQHTGHEGGHMRGTSDLESVWETRLSWTKSKEGLVTVKNEHREAEAGPDLEYRIAWDHDTRSMRLQADPIDDDLMQRVQAYKTQHPDASANEVNENVQGRKTDILKAVRACNNLSQSGSGTTGNHPLKGPLPSGSPAPPFRGAGTTLEAPVPEPPEQEELDDDIPF